MKKALAICFAAFALACSDCRAEFENPNLYDNGQQLELLREELARVRYGIFALTGVMLFRVVQFVYRQ